MADIERRQYGPASDAGRPPVGMTRLRGWTMLGDMFRSPEVILFSRDVDRAAAFYRRLGFVEKFRVPENGVPIHVDLELDGYRIGFASMESARRDHGLTPSVVGQRGTVTLWTDDTAAAYDTLLSEGVVGIAAPARWLDRLLIAWVQDPDGHAIQLAQELTDVG